MTHVAAAFLSEDELVWRLDLLARNKMNVLHINFADALAFTLPTRRFPGLNDTTDPMTPGAYGVYTRAELRRLVSAAESRHVEIIPGINTPGHGAYWLRQLRCDAPDASETAMCVGNEATYTFLEQLLEEVAPLFPGPHFHIGTDELEFRDRPDVRVSWRTCSHCRRRMAQEGLADTRELFYYFVRRLRNILAGCGKRLVMWNDSVDLARPVDLPPDIRMQFWRVAGPGRGPRRGCSLSKLARTGFEIINSFFPDTYVDVHTRDERLLDWHPHKRPPVPRAFRSRIIGGEACSWRLSDTYPGELYLPPFLAVFGDRLWNRRRIDDPDAFASGLTRHTFGPHTPAELASVHHVDGGHLTRTGNGLFDANPGVLEAPSPRARRQQLTAILEVLGKPSVQRRLMNQPALRALRAHLRDLD